MNITLILAENRDDAGILSVELMVCFRYLRLTDPTI